MKKRIILVLIFLLLIPLLIIMLYPFLDGSLIQLIEMESEIKTHEWYKKRLKRYKIKICDFNLTHPSYSLITEEDILGRGKLTYEILHYELGRAHPFSFKWGVDYLGGTTVKNTTYPQLLKLVKKDCDRFQKSSSLNADPNDTRWVYSKAEPPKTPEQIAEQKKKDRDYLYEFYIQDLSKYNKKEIEILVKIFGDWREMPKEEFIDFMEAQKNKQLTPKEQKEVDLIRKARKKRGAEQEARDLK